MGVLLFLRELAIPSQFCSVPMFERSVPLSTSIKRKNVRVGETFCMLQTQTSSKSDRLILRLVV
jgi:hypothetical protein